MRAGQRYVGDAMLVALGADGLECGVIVNAVAKDARPRRHRETHRGKHEQKCEPCAPESYETSPQAFPPSSGRYVSSNIERCLVKKRADDQGSVRMADLPGK